MEKTVHSPINYPRMPAEMSYSGAQNAGEPILAAPPSYEQATGSATTSASYPPVQVLPTPPADTLRRPRPPPIPLPTTSPAQPNAFYNNNAPYPTSHASASQRSTYAPPPMAQQPVVIIQQHAVLPVGPDPTYITCPACHVAKLTRIDYEPSSRTHLMAALLCVFGLWCCVCLPYCAGSCMNANHYCGNCNKFLGTYGGGAF